MELREALHKAGTTFDGHVTNGSMEAQVKVVGEYLEEFFASLKAELKAAGDFGLFKEELPSVDRPYPEYVAIEVLKKVREKYA